MLETRMETIAESPTVLIDTSKGKVLTDDSGGGSRSNNNTETSESAVIENSLVAARRKWMKESVLVR